jgi:hypothetical protein
MAVLAHAWRRESSKPFADGVPAYSYERGFGAESFTGRRSSARLGCVQDVVQAQGSQAPVAFKGWASAHSGRKLQSERAGGITPLSASGNVDSGFCQLLRLREERTLFGRLRSGPRRPDGLHRVEE